MSAKEVVASSRKLSEFENLLNGIASQFDRLGLERLLQAVNGLLAALHHADEILVQSSTNSLYDAFRVTYKDLIEKLLKSAEQMRQGLRRVWDEHVDGWVYDNPDNLRGTIESTIDRALAAMMEGRKGVMHLEELGYPVENANRLETGILELQTWKQGIFQNWPSPNKVPSRLDREALAEVRAAVARGQRGLSKEAFIESCKTKTQPGG